MLTLRLFAATAAVMAAGCTTAFAQQDDPESAAGREVAVAAGCTQQNWRACLVDMAFASRVLVIPRNDTSTRWECTSGPAGAGAHCGKPNNPATGEPDNDLICRGMGLAPLPGDFTIPATTNTTGGRRADFALCMAPSPFGSPPTP